ncbi:unnamed protein product [Lathyrus sativus]|nr:unnamed protein product [Lathyrus sativus]
MIGEGLDTISLKNLISQLKELGFNCVRYTWATHMFTRYSTYKVGENFDKLNLIDFRLTIRFYNPSLENITVVEAFDLVIDEFGKQDMMVLVDNHVSDPKWCCDDNDGNGFFGDKYFNPVEWLKALSNVAERVKGKSQVVAIGLRNELRGPNQNQNSWHKYMSQGATAVHNANPDVLVFVSGLSYDTDLSFLKTNPLNTNIGNKLVYEVHSYAWSSGSRSDWIQKPLNQKCANVMNGLNDKAGFLMSGSNPSALVMTEFGMNMEALDNMNQRFMSCIMAYLVGNDLDWALWAAQEFPQRFQLLHKKLLEANSNSSKSYIMYHPLSGQCVRVSNNDKLELGECEGPNKWNQEGQQIKLVENGACMEAISEGSQVKLSSNCKSKQSFWKKLSASNLHLSTLDREGNNLCLERESPTSPKIVTNKCICVDDSPSCLDDPQSQWFQLVTTNV